MSHHVKKLYRSRTDRVIAGIAGGLGRYFNIDPLLVRILFILFAITKGFGVLLYIILWIAIPEEHRENAGEREHASDRVQEVMHNVEKEAEKIADKAESAVEQPRSTAKIIGMLMILVGAFALLGQIFPMHWFQWRIFWPSLTILVGLYIILRRTGKQ